MNRENDKIIIQVSAGSIFKHDFKEALGIRHHKEWCAMLDNIKADPTFSKFEGAYQPFTKKHSISVRVARMILEFIDNEYKDNFSLKFNTNND